jgi:hypothetical protein
MLSCVLPEQAGRQLDRLIKVLRMAFDDFWVDSRHYVLTPGSGAVPWPGAWICRAAQCPAGAGWSAARLARSAAVVMLRSIPPNTMPWNGDMALQYACPASPRGWKMARWL